jgi:hypothetical protein
VRFFFYGTLIDPDIRRVVLGAPAANALVLRPGVLCGWMRRAVRSASYPMILPRAGAGVDGILASGLDAVACRRLRSYEGAEYLVVRVQVRCADGRGRDARVFAPRPGGGLKPRAVDWDHAAWSMREKRCFLRRIADEFGA